MADKKEITFCVCLRSIRDIYNACNNLKHLSKDECIKKLANELIEKIESRFDEIEKIHNVEQSRGKMFYTTNII